MQSIGFFNSIINPERYSNIDSVFVVIHANADFTNFLSAISKVTRIAGVIPKSSSKKFANLKKLKKIYPVYDVDREWIIANPEGFIKNIDFLSRNERFAVIDMGGYFSHVLSEISKKFEGQIIGIVEDTENGHQKYESVLNSAEIPERLVPIISVARSPLKNSEDSLVGHAIVFSGEAILRAYGLILLGKRVGVIGFGKIGQSIAFSLLSRGSRVDVFDSNPIHQATALSLGFHTSSRSDFLSNADILFCATGNKSLSLNDVSILKDGLHIFCATSADDEFSNCLREIIETEAEFARKNYSNFHLQGKHIYIHNEGNSVNFVHGAVVDKFIELVQGEIIFSIGSLSDAPRGLIWSLPEFEKRFIAKRWLSYYQNFRGETIDF